MCRRSKDRRLMPATRLNLIDIPMKEEFTLLKSVDNEVLLEIARRRFPLQKSYTQTYLNGKSVCIDKNKFYKAVVKIKHKEKKNTSTLSVIEHGSFLGMFLGGALGVWIASKVYRKFFDGIKVVFQEEMSARTYQR